MGKRKRQPPAEEDLAERIARARRTMLDLCDMAPAAENATHTSTGPLHSALQYLDANDNLADVAFVAVLALSQGISLDVMRRADRNSWR